MSYEDNLKKLHSIFQEIYEKSTAEGTVKEYYYNDISSFFKKRILPKEQYLDQLEKNDEFYIHILGKTLAYKVFNVETVKPEEMEHLTIAKGQDRVTLVTCTPYGINTHRLLVHARRVPYKTESTNSQKNTLWKWLLKQRTFLISTGVLVLLIIYSLVRSRQRRRQKRRKHKKKSGSKKRK